MEDRTTEWLTLNYTDLWEEAEAELIKLYFRQRDGVAEAELH